MNPQPCYIGIDPGESGGIAALWGEHIITTAMPENEQAICDWFNRLKKLVIGSSKKRSQQALEGCHLDEPHIFACIEEQQPRPTHFKDKETGQLTHSILRSTCILYGNYRMMLGILAGLGIQTEKVLPKKWQSDIGTPKKVKGTSDHKWKSELKRFAQEMYPDIKITLAVSDALLIAAYCKKGYGTIDGDQT